MSNISDLPAPSDWNEVAVLIEALRGDFRIVAEGVADLGPRMTRVHEGLATLTDRVTTLEDVVRTYLNHRHN